MFPKAFVERHESLNMTICGRAVPTATTAYGVGRMEPQTTEMPGTSLLASCTTRQDISGSSLLASAPQGRTTRALDVSMSFRTLRRGKTFTELSLKGRISDGRRVRPLTDANAAGFMRVPPEPTPPKDADRAETRTRAALHWKTRARRVQAHEWSRDTRSL